MVDLIYKVRIKYDEALIQFLKAMPMNSPNSAMQSHNM